MPHDLMVLGEFFEPCTTANRLETGHAVGICTDCTVSDTEGIDFVIIQ